MSKLASESMTEQMSGQINCTQSRVIEDLTNQRMKGTPESVAVLAKRSLAPIGRLPGQSVSWFPSATMVGTWREMVSYWSKPTSH